MGPFIVTCKNNLLSATEFKDWNHLFGLKKNVESDRRNTSQAFERIFLARTLLGRIRILFSSGSRVTRLYPRGHSSVVALVGHPMNKKRETPETSYPRVTRSISEYDRRRRPAALYDFKNMDLYLLRSIRFTRWRHRRVSQLFEAALLSVELGGTFGPL